jgi:transcriptional/translational regulatory protein YebC/TACO1
MLRAIDAGAEDIETGDDFFAVTTAREAIYKVRDNLEEENYDIESAELMRIPMTEVKVEDDTALSNFKLMAAFDDNDDVSEVFTNMQMDDETLAIGEQLE